MVIDTPVTSFMTTRVRGIHPETSVKDAAKALAELDITGLPVVEDGELIGIITEYDLISQEINVDTPAYFSFLDAIITLPGSTDEYEDELRRVLATKVRDLMSHPVYSVTHDALVSDVATLMFEHHFNPIPVLDENEDVIGIVSRSDIVRLIASQVDELEDA